MLALMAAPSRAVVSSVASGEVRTLLPVIQPYDVVPVAAAATLNLSTADRNLASLASPSAEGWSEAN